MTTLVLIPVDDPVEVLEVEPSLAGLQHLVGGFIECVALDDELHGYCNEEGKLDGLRINVRATRLVETYRPGFMAHDVIVGDFIVLGMTADGAEADVSTKGLVDISTRLLRQFLPVVDQ